MTLRAEVLVAPLVAEAVHSRLLSTPKVLGEVVAAFGSVSSLGSFVPNKPLVPTVGLGGLRFAQKPRSAPSLASPFRLGAGRRILLAERRGTPAPR